MNPGAAACPKCRSAFPGALVNPPAPLLCPACTAIVRVEIFPALFQAAAVGRVAENIVEEGSSSCFYHEKKKAVAHCDICGRFLCALCDVDFGGQHLCPACLKTGQTKGHTAALERSRLHWDSLALSTAILPMILFPVVILTAPAAIVLAVISLFKRRGLVPRGPLRAIFAILLALIEITGWFYVFILRDT
jgi:hypothetical protein